MTIPFFAISKVTRSEYYEEGEEVSVTFESEDGEFRRGWIPRRIRSPRGPGFGREREERQE